MEKLRLRKTGSKMNLRINAIVLAVLLIVAIAVGYVVGSKGVITGKSVGACIPQKDFQFFIDKSNIVQADYQKCVSDLWALQFTYRQQTGAVPSKVNITKTNATK